MLLDEELVPVRAKITTLRGISAHADRTELLRWLLSIPSVKTAALHHGDREAQEVFRVYVEHRQPRG